jgi:coenzyme PQQ precursor peptide PqqA
MVQHKCYNDSQRRVYMNWTTPEFEEISMSAEINSYAAAEI